MNLKLLPLQIWGVRHYLLQLVNRRKSDQTLMKDIQAMPGVDIDRIHKLREKK